MLGGDLEGGQHLGGVVAPSEVAVPLGDKPGEGSLERRLVLLLARVSLLAMDGGGGSDVLGGRRHCGGDVFREVRLKV